MSLPAAQQRVLDGIADGLRRSEPKLASMFAIFARLCASEAPPHREQLAGGRLQLATLWSRLLPARGRWAWRRVLIVSQLAIAFVALSVLVGLSSPGAASCGPRAVAHARTWCPAPMMPGGLVGK